MNDYFNKLTLEFDRIKPNDSYLTDGGYGIIYVGGGKYWPGIVVGIKMLRYFGCNLPVEIWYRGNVEAINRDDIDDNNIRYYNIDGMRTPASTEKPDGPNGGWQAKLFALMNTRLSKVLYLDADAYVVNDPCGLFRYLDKDSFCYWRDLPNQEKSIKWSNVWPKGDNGITAVQGGQLVIDRINAWKLIHVSDYMCRNSEYYFKHMYGDQDAWRVGLAMGCSSRHIIGKADWNGVAFICSDNNHPMIIHRCQGKLFNPYHIPKGRHRYSNPQYYLPEEKQVFEYLTEVVNKQLTDHASTFSNVYEKNLWNGSSGAGSSLKEAQTFIDICNSLIRSKNYKTGIDVGCGNAIVGTRLNFDRYVGYDCVKSVIDDNIRRYKNSLSISFFHLDFFKECDIIQYGDILICKDVLHHWPNRMVVEWLDRIIKLSKWKMILLCQDKDQRQSDCWLGGYRGLDHTKYPLNQFPFQLYKTYHHKSILIYER